MFDQEMAVAVVEGNTEPTYLEASGDGAVMVELDSTGEVIRCQIEPEVNASWSAELLADRLVRLYRLAWMRVGAAQRSRANERGAAVPPTSAWPTQSEVDEYRRSIDF